MESTPLFELFDEDFKNLPTYNQDSLRLPERSEALLKQIFNCIDLTSLNTTDCSNSIEDFCEKVADFPKKFPDMPNVAAVCVYPVFASILASKLKNVPVNRAVVSASFPSAQTFLETKVEETKRALFFGANEVDIVISVGEFLEGNYEFVGNEISTIKEVTGKAHLKVILETGALNDTEDIWKASLMAMEAGADFIKTSTGKMTPAATPEAAWVMTHAIKAYAQRKSKMIGFKPAGGIATVEEALLYWTIQEQVLGEKWLNKDYFRIGASRLANNLLSEIESMKGNQQTVSYF